MPGTGVCPPRDNTRLPETLCRGMRSASRRTKGNAGGLRRFHPRGLCHAAPENYLHVCVWTFQVDFWVIVPLTGLVQAWLMHHGTFLLSSNEASASFTMQCSRGPGHFL